MLPWRGGHSACQSVAKPDSVIRNIFLPAGVNTDMRLDRQRAREERPRPFGVLVRHFFGRFFDTESLSPQGDPQASMSQTLGVLAAPSAFFVLVFRPLTLVGWSLVWVRYIFLLFSMIVMGFIMVFEWDALFPDRRDYQILTPLPLRLPTVFLAKVAALGIFLAVFLLDINFLGVLLWPGVDGGDGFFAIFLVHITALLAGGLFSALAIGALHGLLITFLSGDLYRRVSITIQTVLMGALVMLLVLTLPMGQMIHGLLKSHSPALYWFPGFWFIGLYERLRPATHDAGLLALGGMAIQALWISAAVFLLTYLPGYRRHARKILEAPAPSPSGPGPLFRGVARGIDKLFLRGPVESAVFHFIGQTITRSMKHRLFLATYGGFGAALAVMTLVSGPTGLLRLPLTLSFVLVSGLRAAFNFPSELSANWAFQISETAYAAEYVAATRKWIALCALLPLFAMLAVMEFACFAPALALLHVAFGFSLSVALTEAMFFGFRKVPFTCAHLPGKVNMSALVFLYIFGFTMYSRLTAGLEAWLAVRPVAATAFLVSLGLGWLLFARWRARAARRAVALDYEDPGDPVIRTLGLSPQ